MEQRYKVDYPAIARRVKEARRRAGLTQEQLAEQIDISANAVAKLENNLMNASLQTLVNIANALQLDMNDLLGVRARGGERDPFLEGLLADLSPKDRYFLIYVINGLKLYR